MPIISRLANETDSVTTDGVFIEVQAVTPDPYHTAQESGLIRTFSCDSEL